jgi:DNA modification methylase
MNASLVRADSVHLPLADASVDLVVTSPPYFALRSYKDDGAHYEGQIGSEETPAAFLDALWAVTAECQRVLKPSGSIFVNLGDKYAGGGGGPDAKRDGRSNRAVTRESFASTVPNLRGKTWGAPAKSLLGLPWRYAIGCIDQLDLILRAEVIWSKPNGLPESVQDRVRRSHEQWFHFTKCPRYYSAMDEIRDPYSPDTEARYATGYGPRPLDEERTVGLTLGDAQYEQNPLGKLPGSVWTIPSEPLVVPEHLGLEHFAAFPQEWPRRFILGWSPSGICTECGEGRWPVAESERVKPPNHGPGSTTGRRSHEGDGPNDHRVSEERFDRRVTITGYECDCPDASAPTRPAVVLDPFGGTGTTAMVARALDRFAINIDLSADYLRLADWRINRSGHAAKSMSKTWGERQGMLL